MYLAGHGTNSGNSCRDQRKGTGFYRPGQAWQYGLRFLVDVDGVEVILERDDSGEFRAILPEGFTGKAPDKATISVIIDVLQSV